MADQKAQIVLSATDRSKAAFDSFKRNVDTAKASAEGLALKFGLIGTALATVFEGVTLKGAIDAADNLSKLSQRTGIAIEELSALKLGAELSDVSVEELAKGLKTLAVNMAAAAGGNKEAKASFDAIGVSVTDSAGKLRATDAVLGDVADRFASYKDGAGKAALANEVFKKGGDKLIPFLNQGRDGIAALRVEAEKLGIVMGGSLGKNAEDFNDNLTRLHAAAQGAKLALAGELLPTLNATLEAFVENAKAAGLFKGALLTLGQGIKARLGFDELGTLETQAKGTSAEIERTTNVMVGLSNTLQREPGNEAAQRRFDNLRKKLVGLQADAQKTNEAIKALADDKTKTATKPEPPKQTKEAPIVKKGTDTAAADALAELKKNLQGAQQALEQGLADQQDLVKFNQTFLDRSYQVGNVSLASYYDQQDQIRKQGLEAQRTAYDQEIQNEIEGQAKLKAKGAKPEDIAESNNRIQAIRAKLAAAEREFAQASQLGSLERPEAIKQQTQALEQFEAQFADMVSGARDRQGELADIAAKVEQAKKQIVGSVGPEEADKRGQALQAQLILQRQFNLARDEFARVTDRARDAEDALALVQQQKGTGLLEGERQITALRQQELEQLGKVLETTRAIAAANPNNEALISNLRQVEIAYAHLAQTVDVTKQRMDAAADSLGDGIAGTLGRAVTEGGKLKDILNDVLKQISQSLTQEGIVKPISKQISNFIKGTDGQGAGENLLGIGTGQRSGAKTPAATATDSLTSLKTLGVDPTTTAFTQLTAQINATIGALSKPGNEPLKVDAQGIGIDAAGHGFSASKDTGVPVDTAAQTAATDADKASAAASNAAATAALNLSNGANAAQTALGLLPSVINLIKATATASAASSGSDGWLSKLGSLFGGSSGGSDAAVSGGANLSANGFAGFEVGGYTGRGGRSQPRGVVHGEEYVFSAPAVSNIGVGNLERAHKAARSGVRGYASGGFVGQMSGRSNAAPQKSVTFHQTLIQNFGPGATQKTTSQAAGQAAREAGRYLNRGGA